MPVMVQRRTSRLRITYSLALAATVALVLSGCGGSSSTTASSTPASGGAAAGASAGSSPATGTPYLVGVITSASGPGGESKETAVAAQSWADHTNANGGINGHPVKLIVVDDATTPAKASQAAQDMIDKKVLAIMDGSFVNNAFQKAVNAAKIPVISLDGSGKSFLYVSDPNFFANSTTVDAIVYGQVYAAKNFGGGTKFGDLYCAENPNCALALPLMRSYAKDVGIEVAYTAAVAVSAANYTAQCLAAKQAGVDAMFVGSSSDVVSIRVGADCAKQGFTPVRISVSGVVPVDALTKPGFERVVGLTNVIPWFSDGTPATATFQQVMGGYVKTAKRPALVVAGWTGMELFKKAAANAGDSPTSADIYKGLYALNGDTLGGLAPPLTFKEGRPNPVHCFYEIRSKDAKWTAPNGTEPTCVKLPAPA